MSAYSDTTICNYDPFGGNERGVDVRLRRVSVVTIRKPQRCLSPALAEFHDIQPGTRARLESGLIEGVWGRYYVCAPCMEAWLKELNIPPSECPAQNSSEGR